jgi:hypothetical protein
LSNCQRRLRNTEIDPSEQMTTKQEDALNAQLAELQHRFGDALLGFVEIGSRPKGEAVQWSDHDLRVVLRTGAPFVISNDRRWSAHPADAVFSAGGSHRAFSRPHPTGV